MRLSRVLYSQFDVAVTPAMATCVARPEKYSPVRVEMFAPENGHKVGIGGRGWFVDMEVELDVPLERSRFTTDADGKHGFQLTGPNAPASGNFATGMHNNVNPFPETFPLGTGERLPGLIVLLSTTAAGAGSCQNLANLFNLTGVTDLDSESVE